MAFFEYHNFAIFAHSMWFAMDLHHIIVVNFFTKDSSLRVEVHLVTIYTHAEYKIPVFDLGDRVKLIGVMSSIQNYFSLVEIWQDYQLPGGQPFHVVYHVGQSIVLTGNEWQPTLDRVILALQVHDRVVNVKNFILFVICFLVFDEVIPNFYNFITKINMASNKLIKI